jgi:hypothetical protein
MARRHPSSEQVAEALRGRRCLYAFPPPLLLARAAEGRPRGRRDGPRL